MGRIIILNGEMIGVTRAIDRGNALVHHIERYPVVAWRDEVPRENIALGELVKRVVRATRIKADRPLPIGPTHDLTTAEHAFIRSIHRIKREGDGAALELGGCYVQRKLPRSIGLELSFICCLLKGSRFCRVSHVR